MLVSKNNLSSYPITEDRYFLSRWERDSFFNGSSITPGTYCAVADNIEFPADYDNDTPWWNLEQYNGVNWTLVSIDADSFALFVTNEGLRALTYVEPGEEGYKCHISRVVVRETSIPQDADIINYNDTWFRFGASVQGNNRNLTVLDTNDYKINPTFTLSNNLSYRINLANGGLQYMILFDVDTIGLDYYSSASTPPAKDTFTIGAIGLYVKDPTDKMNEILFAIGNIANPIYKYASTATRVGNSVKAYLNTTLSNLGTVEDVKVMPTEFGGIPEVVSEDQLDTVCGNAVSVPHNIYLVDDLYDTGIPALAVRKGNPEQGTAINWAFFSPVDNIIDIRDIPVDGKVKDYMAVQYDGTKYVRATGDSGALGIKIGDSIIYNGKVVNSAKNYSYNIEIPSDGKGTDYKVGDILYLTEQGITIKVEEIIASTGAVKTISWSPTEGDKSKAGVGLIPTGQTVGSGLKVNLSSTSRSNIYPWYFNPNWLNKPLYVSDSTPGTLTNEYSETFIGWCTGTNSIKLSLDLRNEATYNDYGTTKYASNDTVRNGTTDADKDRTSVTPSKLKANFLQITQPDTATTIATPINVDTYVRFNHPILGAGSDFSGTPSIDENVVSFYGRSYRAQWGDLAEFYRSDRVYLPGTLITIGFGKEEITIADIECNGIISTEPGYTLGDKHDKYDLPVALTGKVPVRFAKDCDPQFGDRIYLSKTEPGKASTIPHGKCLGKIIDKDKDLSLKTTIMCSVRIEF